MTNCSFIWYLEKYMPHKVAIASMSIALCPIVVVLNLTLIVSFVTTRQVTQNTSNILIFFVSLCDLASGIIFLPLTANMFLNFTANDVCIKAKAFMISTVFNETSQILTILIAFDRYLHMNPDLRSRQSKITQIFKRPFIYYLVAIIFLLNFTFCTASALIQGKRDILDETLVLFPIFLTSICMLATTCLYMKGYQRIRRFTDNNPVYQENSASDGHPSYVRNLYKTVLVLICLVCIHNLPYTIVSVIITILDYLNKTYDNNMAAYIYESSLPLLVAGKFTNCLAVLYFNKKAKCWIFNKLRVQSVTDRVP